MPKIGAKLKDVRRRRGLGLRELAVRSGVSHSTISLLERDRMSPSVDTLGAILDALGTTLTGFFSELALNTTYSPFYAADEHVEIGRVDSISYRMVGVNHPNRHILMLQERYSVAADSGQAYAHEAQECGIVTKGAVEVTVGMQSRILHEGDGYYFDSRLPHRFRNASDGTSEIISAISPPTY